MADSDVRGSGGESDHLLITAPEAARLAQVSPQAIRRACGQQRVPGAKRDDHGHWLIPRLAAERWGSGNDSDAGSASAAGDADALVLGVARSVDVTDRTLSDHGPAQVASGSAKHLSGSASRSAMLAELAGLRAEVAELRTGTFATAEVLRLRAENAGLHAQVAALADALGECEGS